MAKKHKEYYAVITRQMLRDAKKIGDAPFKLFQYYLTWLTASNGIKPSLDLIAEDLGLKKSNICNLRNVLIEHGWITYKNGQVYIIKDFTENHSSEMNDSFKMNPSVQDSSEMNLDSSDVNLDSFKMNPIYKEEDSKEITKNTQETPCVSPQQNKKSIPVNAESHNAEFIFNAWDEIQRRKLVNPLNTPDWNEAINYTATLSKNAEDFKNCLDWISTWAKHNITPKMVANKFSEFIEVSKPQTPKPVGGSPVYTKEMLDQREKEYLRSMGVAV